MGAEHPDEEIVAALQVGLCTVGRVRQRLVRVRLFFYDVSNLGFPASCQVRYCHQPLPVGMSCRCGRALGIAENLAW